MPTKRLPMRLYREILRLRHAGGLRRSSPRATWGGVSARRLSGVSLPARERVQGTVGMVDALAHPPLGE